MRVESRAENIHSTDCRIYEIVANCRSIEKMMPPQVTDCQATEDECEFSVPGMAKVKLQITGKQEFSKVEYRLSANNIPITITFLIDGQDDLCNLHLIMEAQVPIFLQAVIEKPIRKVADTMVEKIKTEVEKN